MLIMCFHPESEKNVCQWVLKHGPKEEDAIDMLKKPTEKNDKVVQKFQLYL